jgi:hypothetical protein
MLNNMAVSELFDCEPTEDVSMLCYDMLWQLQVEMGTRHLPTTSRRTFCRSYIAHVCSEESVGTEY